MNVVLSMLDSTALSATAASRVRLGRAPAAGAVASNFGLRDTAYIYGAALIVLAAVMLALSHQLEDPQSVQAA